MAPPNCRPPDPSFNANKKRNQSGRTSKNKYVIPARRNRGEPASATHTEKTRNRKISVKNDDGELLHTASFHHEVNSISNGSQSSPTLPKGKERSSGESDNSLEEITQTLRKLRENGTNIEISIKKTTKEVEKTTKEVNKSLALSYKLLASWSLTNGDGSLEYDSTGRVTNDKNKAERQENSESESRADLLCRSEKTIKRRILQRSYSSTSIVSTRLGCGFRLDKLALKLVLQRTPLWQQSGGKLIYENIDDEQSREFRSEFEGKYKEDQKDLQKEGRERSEIKIERDRAALGVEYFPPSPWQQDRPPDKRMLTKGLEVILRKNEERVEIRGGPVKYKKGDPERSQIFWDGKVGKFAVQNEKRVRVNGTIEEDGAKLGSYGHTRSYGKVVGEAKATRTLDGKKVINTRELA